MRDCDINMDSEITPEQTDHLPKEISIFPLVHYTVHFYIIWLKTLIHRTVMVSHIVHMEIQVISVE